MKNPVSWARFSLITILLTALFFEVRATDAISAAEYQLRRDRVAAALDSHAVALLSSSTIQGRGRDLNFYYLTGCKSANAMLLMAPRGVDVHGVRATQFLFLPSGHNVYSGDLRGDVPLTEAPGAMIIVDKKKYDEISRAVLSAAKTLYVPAWPQNYLHDPISDKRFFIERDAKKALAEKYPHLQIKSLTGRMTQLRQIKSQQEIQLLRKAAEITARALCEAMRSAEPGLYEYDLQAIIEFVFKRLGAEDSGFSSILGSGPNALILHYEHNRRQMQPGDLVVMDVGAQYEGYGADITRTIPVSGRFTPAQRDLYEIVLKANLETTAMMQPGVPYKEVEAKAAAIVAEGLIKLGLLQDAKEVKKFLPHGVSHPIGLETHDVFNFTVLEPGQVLTIEPGIYVPENAPGVDPRYWGIGIRIEDDVLITAQGHEVLTNAVPRTIADIEKRMKEKGLGQVRIN